jgi:hypothetical protein
VGWALPFASVTCLQEYIRWDPLVLGAQPLDTSPRVCASTVRCCFLLNCLSVLYLSSWFLQHLLGAHLGLQRWWFVTSFVAGVHPLTAGRRSHQASTGWSRGGFVPVSWGEGLGGVGTYLEAWLIRLVRTQVQIQAYLRRQKGRLVTSQRLLVTAF